MPVGPTQEMPTRALRAHPSNSRTHPNKQIRQLARSIEQFGFTIPIIVDENRTILAGHGRWLAVQQLALQSVPVVVLSGLSEAERRAYLLADNKLAGCATPASSAGHAPTGAETVPKLTLPPDHPKGADQARTRLKLSRSAAPRRGEKWQRL